VILSAKLWQVIHFAARFILLVEETAPEEGKEESRLARKVGQHSPSLVCPEKAING